MTDTLIEIKKIKCDTFIFEMPASLRLLDGISVKDSVTIIFTGGKLTKVDIKLRNLLNIRNMWHVNKAVSAMIEELEKAY